MPGTAIYANSYWDRLCSSSGCHQSPFFTTGILSHSVDRWHQVIPLNRLPCAGFLRVGEFNNSSTIFCVLCPYTWLCAADGQRWNHNFLLWAGFSLHAIFSKIQFSETHWSSDNVPTIRQIWHASCDWPHKINSINLLVLGRRLHKGSIWLILQIWWVIGFVLFNHGDDYF